MFLSLKTLYRKRTVIWPFTLHNYTDFIKTYKNDTVTQKFIELCEANHYTYGYRKITTLINQCYTSLINHKRVQRIMQKHHLNCRVRPKRGQGEVNRIIKQII